MLFSWELGMSAETPLLAYITLPNLLDTLQLSHGLRVLERYVTSL